MSPRLALALACAAPLAANSVAAQEHPRVLVIATGGTIASRPGIDQLTGAALVEAVPDLADVARIEVEEFSRIGSSGMTPDHWLRLSRRVNQLFADDAGLAGVVVTHGTDTMEETAYFLHLTVRDERPVVLTGSMRSATAVSADGPANLLSGVRVAVSEAARGHGVLVVLNDEIHSARDVRKTDNNRVQTFTSREWGALGVVDADGVRLHRRLLSRHTVGSGLSLGDAATLPTVPIVADFAGSDGSAVHAWVERGVDGLVVQAFGGGRGSPGMRRAAQDAAAAGVAVVMASRVPEGRIMRSVAWAEQGIVAAGDLPPHKARVLLMLSLLRTRAAAEIQALFDAH